MNDKQWDKRLFDFLKRTGEEIKSETQKIVDEVRDPETQRKVRESLKEFGTWAKQTAEEAAEMLEGAIKKAETAFTQPVDRAAREQAPSDSGDKTASASKPGDPPPSSSANPRKPAAKTVGKKKSSGARKARSSASTKTIGRRS